MRTADHHADLHDETHRGLPAQSRRRRGRGGDGLRVRPDEPGQAAAAAVPRHRTPADVHPDRLARRLAAGDGVGDRRADRNGDAGPARAGGNGLQRQCRQQLHQPDLRRRQRHGRDAGGSAVADEPSSAAAARRHATGRAGRRGQRQQLADLLLRAEASRHARRHPRLPAVHRGSHRAATDLGRRRGRRGHQWRRSGGADHHPGPGARGGARHPDPGRRGRGRARHRRVRRRGRSRPPRVCAALRRSLLARRAGQPDPGLARWPTGAPGRCRHCRGQTARTALLRLPERQSRHRPAHPARERRQRARHAGRGQARRRRRARAGTQPDGPGHRPEFRCLGLHQPCVGPAVRQPHRRRAAGRGLPVVVPARYARHRADRLRHSHFAAGHLHRAATDRAQPQRHLAGRPRVRGGHGDGCRGGGGREHRAPARAGPACGARGAGGHAPGRRRAGRFHADDGGGVPAGDLHGGRGGPTFCRSRPDHFHRGGHLAADRRHRVACSRGELAAHAPRRGAPAPVLVAPQRLGIEDHRRPHAPARLGRRACPRARPARSRADAADRLPAAGEARGRRRLLQLPARHEPGAGEPRDRPGPAGAHAPLHGRRERSAAEQLVSQPVAGRRHAGRARGGPGRHRRTGAHRARRDRGRLPGHARLRQRGRAVRQLRRLRARDRHPPAAQRWRCAGARRGGGPQGAFGPFRRCQRAGLAQRRRRHAGTARQSRRPSPGRNRLAAPGARHRGTHAGRRAMAGRAFRWRPAPGDHPAQQRRGRHRAPGCCPAGHAAGRRAEPGRPGTGGHRAGAEPAAPHRPSPHGHPHRRSAGCDVAGRSAGHRQRRDRAQPARRAAARRRHPHFRQRRPAGRSGAQHGPQLRDGAGGAVHADGRDVPLAARQRLRHGHAADGGAGRRGRPARAGPGGRSDAGPAIDDRLHHATGHGDQQRHPAGRADARSAGRRRLAGRCPEAGPATAPAPDPDRRPHRRAGCVADGHQSGPRRGDLSRPGRRVGGWRGTEPAVHRGAGAGAAAPGRSPHTPRRRVVDASRTAPHPVA